MVSTLDSQSSCPGPGAPLTYFNDGGGGGKGGSEGFF